MWMQQVGVGGRTVGIVCVIIKCFDCGYIEEVALWGGPVTPFFHLHQMPMIHITVCAPVQGERQA